MDVFCVRVQKFPFVLRQLQGFFGYPLFQSTNVMDLCSFFSHGHARSFYGGNTALRLRVTAVRLRVMAVCPYFHRRMTVHGRVPIMHWPCEYQLSVMHSRSPIHSYPPLFWKLELQGDKLLVPFYPQELAVWASFLCCWLG